jgi:CheY-like chemotaxis protein
MSDKKQKRSSFLMMMKTFLSICSYILEEQGWEVHTFTDCNNIIEKVSGVLPDVILMDNWIPDAGGIIATQTLKKDETLKHIPGCIFFGQQRYTATCRPRRCRNLPGQTI